jgi:rhamnosyltransferase
LKLHYGTNDAVIGGGVHPIAYVSNKKLMNIQYSSVQLLLSTHNGEKYLPAFIASIELLNFHSLSILVRDDLSTDNTLKILNEWARFSKFNINVDTTQFDVNLGWKSSFDVLIRRSSADIIFFADQDDLWYPDKIENVLHEFDCISAPIMVVHNANIINSNGTLINKNLLLGFDACPIEVPSSKITGGLFGCCLAVNRALVNRYITLHSCSNLGHDYIFTILALSFGHIKHLNIPLISWRYHDNNSSHKIGFLNRFKQIYYLYSISKFESSIAYANNMFSIFLVAPIFLQKLFFVFSRKFFKHIPNFSDDGL